MGWTGKLLGGGIGWVLGGPIGAVIGGVLGNKLDQNSSNHLSEEEETQAIFFSTVFSMLAKFAQADGVVSKAEVYVIDDFVRNDLELDEEARKLAIKIFDEAKRRQDSFEDYARQFYRHFKHDNTLLVSMLDLLMRVAMADDNFHDNERDYIQKAKGIFNISDSQFESIKARYVEEENLDKYYKILGVSPDASLSEIKRNYREKIKEYHPDNVLGKGLPDEFVKFAEEKFKEIQEAYDMIMKQRSHA